MLCKEGEGEGGRTVVWDIINERIKKERKCYVSHQGREVIVPFICDTYDHNDQLNKMSLRVQ